MRRLLLLLAITFCIGSQLFSQSQGNRRYVSVQTAVLKESTGFFAKDLATLSLGDEVTLLSEDGKWAEIRVGNRNGWITSTSLSARRIVSSGAAIAATEFAMAGKGFSPEMEVEYRKNGLDFSLVDSMEKMAMPREELLRFITEGRLGRGDQ